MAIKRDDIKNAVKAANDETKVMRKQSEVNFERDLEQPQQKRKSSADYLRLDLRPGNKDYKSVLETQARQLSIAEQKNISLTRYIQRIIENHIQAIEQQQEKKTRKSTRTLINEKLNTLSEDQLKDVYDVLNVLYK